MLAVYKKRFAIIVAAVVAGVILAMGTAMPALADSYNCGAYGAGAYQSNVCGASTDESGLANTGQSIWPILLAVLLILLGTYMLYRTRKKMKTRMAQQHR